MEFKYFSNLKNEPEIRKNLEIFLDAEQLLPYFAIDSDEEIEGIYNNFIVCNNVGEIFAYAEPIQYDEEKECINLAFASAQNSFGNKAGTMLLQGIRELLPRCCVSSFKPDDKRITDAGFKPYYEDYLMLRDSWIPKTRLGLEFDEGGSTSDGRYDIFVIDDDGDESKADYVVVDNKTIDKDGVPKEVASCTIIEYEEQVCLADVYVDEADRRKGIAGALVNFCIDEYSGKCMLLHTDSMNEAAVGLYKKLGFGIYETSYNFLSDNERNTDE